MTRLVGIAKLASESPSLEAKRRVEYRELITRSFLSKCDSPRMPFRWMINPYRGCEFGCKYCYARYTHEFMELHDPEDFERRIFVKQFDQRAFRAELRKVPVGESIAIGTATDPYQPAERRYRLTQAILETLAQSSGFRIGLITKSDLIARDIPVFQKIARRHYLTLVITITTLDRDLARRLEPLAPRPDLRVAAVRKLTSAGLRTVVNLAPILPSLNDSDPSIDAVAKAAARAGAVGFNGNVVYLKDCAKKAFFPFLEAYHPRLVRRYHERFDRDAYLCGAYPDLIRERIRRVRQRYGLTGGDQPQPELWPEDAQLTLFS
ncbi:MAG TPA: radical SAM protein [Bryobacteraceae bacterium]|nr:radical SAM protein [Bryobacteraceae bacterium]